MTDNRIFVGSIAMLFAIIGTIMWYLDSPIAISGAQVAASEGLVMAILGGLVAAIAFVVAIRKPST
jgi:hypothetical protein